MNIFRDFWSVFSYPYSLVRRFTTETWSILWTRGLVNFLPFVGRPAIEDSSTSTAGSRKLKAKKFNLESVLVYEKEVLEDSVGERSVSLHNTGFIHYSQSDKTSSSSLSDVTVICKEKEASGASTSTAEKEVLAAKIVEALHSSTSSKDKKEVAKVQAQPDSPSKKNTDSPRFLRTKRNSSTMDSDEVAEIAAQHEAKLYATKTLNALRHINKKVKLDKFKLQGAVNPETEGPGTSHSHPEVIKPKDKYKPPKRAAATMDMRRRLRSDSNRPPQLTHFIGVQITNTSILSKLEEVQQKMMDKELIHNSVRKLQKGSFYSDALVPISKSHVTLHVFHIEDDEQLEAVKTAIQKVWEKFQNEFEPEPVTLTVEGTSHFNNSVLFASIQGQAQLDKLHNVAKTLKEEFKALDIHGDDKPFKPHLTLAKLSKAQWKSEFKKYKIRAFPRDLWHDFESTFFGQQNVESLQLLKMRSTSKQNGYYEIVETYPFNISTGKAVPKDKVGDKKTDLDPNDNNN